MIVHFYTKANCSLCEEAYALLTLFQQDYQFTIEERDIYQNEAWLEEYQLIIPTIEINDKRLICEDIKYDKIEALLQRAMENLS